MESGCKSIVEFYLRKSCTLVKIWQNLKEVAA